MDEMVGLRLRSGNKRVIQTNPLLIVALLVIAIFVFLRAWRLNYPFEAVFDEVYFPKMAWQYLRGEQFFDIHPPLGKLMIAASEMVFGNTTLGWRLVPLLFGIGLLPAGYWVMKQLFDDRRAPKGPPLGAGLITALLLAIDGLMIVYSRVGLMDGFMLFFGLLALGFCWRFRRERMSGSLGWRSMAFAGLFAGLAVAVKWIGAGFLPLVAAATLLTLLTSRKPAITFKDFLIFIGSFVILPAILYTIPFLANWQEHFWPEFLLWHQQSWGYNINLDATHPYASKWWSWPFLIRPIWFHYKSEAAGIIGVDGIGNPLVWWASTVAVVYTALVLIYSLIIWAQRAPLWGRRGRSQLVKRETFWTLSFLFAGWLVFYLPWVGVERILFLYHYLGSYLFALLLLGYWLGQAFNSFLGRLFGITFLVAAVVVGLAFVPIWTAYPIPQEWFNKLMWFKSWI